MPGRRFIGKFFDKFIGDQTTTLAASLAFYTALSLAPLLILFVTVSSFVSADLQRSLITQVHGLVGADAAVAMEMVINNAKAHRDLSSLGSVFGLFTLMLSASLIFGELRSTLNRIFAIESRPRHKASYLRLVGEYLEGRVLNMGLALSFVLILIVSLIISSVISVAVDNAYMVALDLGFSFLLYGALFTLVYRYLPDERVLWARAWRGGFLSAALFVLGKQLIGAYLGGSALGSAYGAAGSIVVLLAWVYYSALITFVGAQLSALIQLKQGRTA